MSVKLPHIAILAVAVVSIVLIVGAYGLGILGSSNPSATVVGVTPASHVTISENKPTIILNLTTQNVKIESLVFSLYIDGINSTGGITLHSNAVQFTLPDKLTDGTHYARANVSLGQATLASSSWDFNIDSTPPQITGMSPGNGTTHVGENLVVEVNFTDPAGIDLSRLALRMDGVDITSSSQKSNYSVSYSPAATLSEGTHTFALELYDNFSNTASYSWSLTIKYPVVDTFPPYLIETSPANNSFVSSSNLIVSFHFNDTLSGVDIASTTLKIDNIQLPYNYTGNNIDGWTISRSAFLTDNNHTAEIFFKDSNNNSKTEQILFTVDSTPPSIGGISPSNGSSLSSSSVVISARFMDLVSGVNSSSVIFIVDSYRPAGAIINSSGVSYSAQLSAGSHSVSVRVSDQAGNIARANWAFTVSESNNTEPTESVIILTKTGYFNTETGLPTIVGEVKNNGTVTVKNVYVKGLFLCNDGGVINNDKSDPAIIYGYAEIGVLEPGDVSPFKLEMPSSFPDFVYILGQLAKFDAEVDDFTATTLVPNKNYTFTNVTGVLDGPSHHYNLTGAVTNTGSITISDLKVVGTFYTATKPIAVESIHLYSLDPGETAYFTLMVEDNVVGPLIVRYDLKGSA